MSNEIKSLDHSYLRYANCWEDADVLLSGLAISPGSKVLSIASAGDNSLALLAKDPKIVVAVDVNEVQLKLTELKAASFKALNHGELLAFLGFQCSEKRLDLYQRVRIELRGDTAQFWDKQSEHIDAGIIHAGKFEGYFRLFRKKILPLIHGEKKIDELFNGVNGMPQDEFFQKKWNNWRWRSLFKLFFSKWVMGRAGRDPAFLKQVKIPVAEFIAQKAERHLSDPICRENYFLHYIMKGSFGLNLPYYARPGNFSSIQKRIDRLEIFHGLAEDAGAEFGPFDQFNLSNIFEYMDEKTFSATAESLARIALPKSRMAYWNLMVPRELPAISEKFSPYSTPNPSKSYVDKGFFYNAFHVDLYHG